MQSNTDDLNDIHDDPKLIYRMENELFAAHLLYGTYCLHFFVSLIYVIFFQSSFPV